jgi:hypothetical protein
MQRIEISSCWAVLALLSALVTPGWTAEPPKTISLKSQRTAGAIDRVEAGMELGGDMKLSSEWKVEKLKLQGQATLCYDERTLEFPQEPKGKLQSVRYYDKATAAFTVGSDNGSARLRDGRRCIGVEIDDAKPEKIALFSPHGMLNDDEWVLLDLMADSLMIDRLLPDNPVAVGQSWKHSDAVIATLCGLDRVTRNDVQSVLSSVKDEVARMELSGRVEGTEDGLATTIELKAKYRFEVKAGRITWIGLLVKQKRDAGQVVPGLDVVARVQATVTPVKESAYLTDAALKGLPLTATEELNNIAYDCQDGSWQLVHDRNWRVTTQTGDMATLRMADEGKTLAQCKISALAQTAKSNGQVTLADFQADIQRALDKSFGQFVQAKQSSNTADYRVYRVVVQGKASGVPIRWIYYLIADKLGRQAVLVFDLKEESLERFGSAEEQLVNSFRFLDRKVAAKPESQEKKGGAER